MILDLQQKREAGRRWRSNRLRKHAQSGNPRRPLANTFCPILQPLADRNSFVSLGDIAARYLSRLERGRR